MPMAATVAQYTLGDDVDVAGMIWRRGSSVFVIPVAKTAGERSDLFLTPHRQYAKRGSHAPVIRIATVQIVITDGETLTIAEESQPAANAP